MAIHRCRACQYPYESALAAAECADFDDVEDEHARVPAARRYARSDGRGDG